MVIKNPTYLLKNLILISKPNQKLYIMNLLLELSKVLTTILLVIFISNWNELTHIGNLRPVLGLLLMTMFAMVQYISYMNYKEKKTNIVLY